MLALKYWQMQQTVAIDPSLQAVVNAILAGITAPDNAGIAAILADTGSALPAQIAALSIPSPADVAAIKVKTDALSFTVAGQIDANIQYVNDVEVKGVGSDADPWNPA